MADTRETLILRNEKLDSLPFKYDEASLARIENSPAFNLPEAHAGHIDLFYVARGETTFRYGGTLEGHHFREKKTAL